MIANALRAQIAEYASDMQRSNPLFYKAENGTVTVQGSPRMRLRSYGRRSEGTVPPSICAEHAWVMKSWTQRSA